MLMRLVWLQMLLMGLVQLLMGLGWLARYLMGLACVNYDLRGSTQGNVFMASSATYGARFTSTFYALMGLDLAEISLTGASIEKYTYGAQRKMLLKGLALLAR
jgi:hypothetical protein